MATVLSGARVRTTSVPSARVVRCVLCRYCAGLRLTRRLSRGRCAAAAPPRAAQGEASDAPPRRVAGLAAAFAAAALVASAQPALASRPAALGDGPASAVAQLVGTKGNEGVSGTVTVRDAVNKRGRAFIELEVSLTGLKPGAHGLNIHELGDVSCPDGSCTGASFNPEGLPHGKPDALKKFGASASHYAGEGSRYWRHVGDIGNVTADASGNVKVSFEEPVIALSGPNSVVGRSVVVHADADDYVTEPVAIVAYGTLKPQ